MRVWDPLVRIAHWLLVASILAAWFARGAPHEWLGYAALAIVLLRILWGCVGPAPARFTRFRREERYLGHNPLGGWMIVALLSAVILLAASGWLATTDRFWGVAWVQDLHAWLADLLVALAALHVAGVAYSSLRHRENLVAAMLTGRKRPPAAGDVFE